MFLKCLDLVFSAELQNGILGRERVNNGGKWCEFDQTLHECQEI